MYYRNKILKTSLSLQADVVSKSFARPTHQNSLLYITRHTQIRCAAYMFVVTLCQSVVYWDSNSVCPSQLQPGICWHRGESLGGLYPLATSVIPAYKQTKCIRLCIIYKNDTSSNERKKLDYFQKHRTYAIFILVFEVHVHLAFNLTNQKI